MDKMKASGLTAKELKDSMTFEEAEVTFVCKKLIKQPLQKENMVDEAMAKQFYDGDAEHDMYIGEVVEVLQ